MLSAGQQLTCMNETLSKLKLNLTPEEVTKYFFFVIVLFLLFHFGLENFAFILPCNTLFLLFFCSSVE